MSVVIRNRYSYARGSKLDFVDSPSMTKQSFRKEADINFIVAKARKTGFLVDPMVPLTRKPMFGDFSNCGDYLSVQTRIAQFHADFDSLPSVVRDRFKNDPSQVLEFLANPANDAEAIELGLKVAPVAPAAAAPISQGGTPAVPSPVLPPANS